MEYDPARLKDVPASLVFSYFKDEIAGKNLPYAAIQDQYGREQLHEWMSEFKQRQLRVWALSQKLESLSDDTPEYTEQIQQVLDETRDYYRFLGKLPEGPRGYLLNLAFEEITRDVDSSGKIDGPTYHSIRPRNYIMQIDAITNQLASLGGETQLRVGKQGDQPVLTTVTLDMPDHMRIDGGGTLSTYDKSIINGVTSLLESGNTVFSIPMLYHAMTGKQNPTVDEQLYEEIGQKLEQMRRMMITIDLSEEKEAHFITDENGAQVEIRDILMEGYLLPLNKVSGTINGKRTELFQIIQHPPLYTYSKMRRQLASVRISLLGAPVNNNSTTIPLKTYLLQRIEMMKNTNNGITRQNILYESVYQELGATEAGKTKKMRIRAYTTTILSYFVEQGYIAAYAEYKTGRTVSGVRIEL
jgi:hypothetical protein